MSHFSEVKTQIRNETVLKTTLLRLGYQLCDTEEEQSRTVRGYMGETQTADFKILTKTHYDIGFRKNAEGSFDLVADWELMPKVSGIDFESFSKKIKREYARDVVHELAKKNGFTIESHENEENQELEIVVSKWGPE